nr:MAG TPA: hypothetical protein [Caudoviricetes sp.]
MQLTNRSNDQKERRNYLYATGKIGTALLEEDMIYAAY